MIEEELKATWHKAKGEAKKQWSKLTDDELNKVEGSYDKLSASLEKHYGYTKDKAKKEIKSFLEMIKK